MFFFQLRLFSHEGFNLIFEFGNLLIPTRKLFFRFSQIPLAKPRKNCVFPLMCFFNVCLQFGDVFLIPIYLLLIVF